MILANAACARFGRTNHSCATLVAALAERHRLAHCCSHSPPRSRLAEPGPTVLGSAREALTAATEEYGTRLEKLEVNELKLAGGNPFLYVRESLCGRWALWNQCFR